MNDKQQIPTGIQADDGITCLLMPARIDHLQEGIEERLRRLLKGNPVFAQIGDGLLDVPNERDAMQQKARVHSANCSGGDIQCPYEQGGGNATGEDVGKLTFPR